MPSSAARRHLWKLAADLALVCVAAYFASDGPASAQRTTALSLCALLALYQAALAVRRSRRDGPPSPADALLRPLPSLAAASAVVWLTGGLLSYCYILFLLPILEAAVYAGLRETALALGAILAVYVWLATRPGAAAFVAFESSKETFLRVATFSAFGIALSLLVSYERRLRAAERAMLEQDRLAVLGQMAAGLAHEIRNPLGAIEVNAGILTRARAPEPARRKALLHIAGDVHALNELVTDFLFYAKPVALAKERCDVAELIARAIERYRTLHPDPALAIEPTVQDGLPAVAGDAGKLERALLNLLDNAAEAVGHRGVVRVRARVAAASTGTVEIAVADSGRGIPPELLPRLFEPFFTTRETGTGLGLSIVKKIVEAHGGRIGVETLEGHGTELHVRLPAA